MTDELIRKQTYKIHFYKTSRKSHKYRAFIDQSPYTYKNFCASSKDAVLLKVREFLTDKGLKNESKPQSNQG